MGEQSIATEGGLLERSRMGRNARTSVVLPVYNEAESIRDVIDEIEAVIDDDLAEEFLPAEIILVDDGSSDGTSEILRDIASESTLVTAVHLQRNFGQSCALSAGIDYAVGEFIVTMDADGQNDPNEIPALLATLMDGYDCVSGWRKDRNDSLRKTIPSNIQTYLAKWTGPDINDFGCTLKAYRAEALDSITLYGEEHRYIPSKLHRWGYDITERQVNHRERFGGTTKYGATRLIKGFLDLNFHLFWSRYSTRPLHFLGGFGFLFTTVGGLVGVHAVISKYAFGTQLTQHLPRLILVVAFILFGFQLIMFGFLAEMITKIHYVDRDPYRVESVVQGDHNE